MKNLQSLLSLLFLLFCTISISAQTTRSIGHFSKIKVSTSVKVKLIKANTPSLDFKMTSGAEEDLITEVKNNTLVIKTKNKMFGSNAKASVNVYYTELNEVDASAGASVKSDELIVSAKMDVDVSSGARVDLELKTTDLSVDASSGARAALEGSAVNGDFDVSSGASIEAISMICEKVKAEASSGGRIEMFVNKELKAEASSGGSIRYKGDVEYTNSDAGYSGSIKRIN